MNGTTVWRAPADAALAHEFSGAGLAALGVVGALGIAWVDIVLSDQVGFFFGLCFVLLSMSVALSADIRSLFAAGVLPPLLMFGALTVVAVMAPDTIVVAGLRADAGVVQHVIAGAVDHATALVCGHLLALTIIGLRIAAARD